jgi:hypothetical protein
VVACSFRDPERDLGRPANPVMPGMDDKAADMMAAMASTVPMMQARNALAARMSALSDVASWQALLAEHVHPESLQWAAMQAAMTLNGIETRGDLATVVDLPDGRARIQLCVGMFIDGFMLAAHLDLSATATG